MNDKHLLLLVALAPTAMSLIGIIFAKADLRELKDDMRSMAAKIDQGRADGHKDALEIMRTMIALHERVAVVEAKQK